MCAECNIVGIFFSFRFCTDWSLAEVSFAVSLVPHTAGLSGLMQFSGQYCRGLHERQRWNLQIIAFHQLQAFGEEVAKRLRLFLGS